MDGASFGLQSFHEADLTLANRISKQANIYTLQFEGLRRRGKTANRRIAAV
jgi:hypothetical protein